MVALNNKTVPGNSIIEAIVASIIFMVVFLISIDMLTRIATREADQQVLFMESEMNAVINKYQSGNYSDDIYKESFEWGDIEIIIQPYKDYSDIKKMNCKAVISKNGKVVRHTSLVKSQK